MEKTHPLLWAGTLGCSSPVSDGKFIPDYNAGYGMVLMTQSGGNADLDFRSHYWNNSSTPVSRDSFTQVMRLQASTGFVGIATKAPGKVLTVVGDDSTAGNWQAREAVIRIQNIDDAAADSRFAGCQFTFSPGHDSTADNYVVGTIGAVLTDTSTQWAGDLVFGVKAATTSTTISEAMRIKTGGCVGIGTTAPGGFLSVEGTGNSRGIFVTANGATTYSAIQAEANALTTGSLGYLYSNSASTSTRYLVNIINDNAAATAAVGLRIQQDSTAPALVALGNVGIGQAAPRNPLEVDLNQSNGTLVGDSAAHFGGQHHSSGQIMGLTLGYREANDNYRKVGIVAAGLGDNAARQDFHILVNTANSAASCSLADKKLSIYGTTGIIRVHNKFGIGGDPGTHHLYAAGTASITGSVGIGTATPSELLDVVGASGLDGATPVTLRLHSTNDGNWSNQVDATRIDFSTADTGGYVGAGTKARISSYHRTPTQVSSGGPMGLKFYTAGDATATALTSRMVIDPDGCVGIGTNTPDGILHIAAVTPTVIIESLPNSAATLHIDSTNAAILKLDALSTSVASMITFLASGADPFYIGRGSWSGVGNSHLHFMNSAGTTRMVIQTDGKVGIGTTAPATTLDVNGTISSFTTSTQMEVWGATSGTQVHFRAATAGANRTQLQLKSINQVGILELYNAQNTAWTVLSGNGHSFFNGGNVGIGDSSPAKKFEIKISSTTNQLHILQTIGGGNHLVGYAVGIGLDPEGYGNRNKIVIAAEGTSSGYSRGKLHFLLDAANDSGEATLAESRMTIQDDGKVGIGTVTPNNLLHLYSGASGLATPVTSAQLVLEDDGSNNYISFVNPNTGSAGIMWGDPQDSARAQLIYDHSTGAMTFNAGGAEHMRIESDGKVGIGTTNPSYLLDVRGTVYVNDATYNCCRH